MIISEGFTHRRFEVFEPVPTDRIESVGDFVLGVPQGKFPDFEQEHTLQEWQAILWGMLTAHDQNILADKLGRSIKPETRFGPWPLLDYADLVETPPTFEGDSQKRFWVRRA